jgi:hypothetical protein
MAKARAAGLDWTEVRERKCVVARLRSVINRLLLKYDPTTGEIPDWLPARFHDKWAGIVARGERPSIRRNGHDFYVYDTAPYRHEGRASADKDPGRESPREQASTAEEKPKKSPKDGKQTIRAIPFKPFDEASFPRRQFLYALHYQRGQCTITVGPDGLGKSTLSIGEAVAMATTRNVLGEQPAERCRIWLHNADDDTEEVYRRIGAFCKRHDIPQDELVGWLFVTGKDTFPIHIASGNGQWIPDNITVAAIKATIIENQIDVVIFDPLVTLQNVPENNNTLMSKVIHIFGDIASECNCAIDICHHTR